MYKNTLNLPHWAMNTGLKHYFFSHFPARTLAIKKLQIALSHEEVKQSCTRYSGPERQHHIHNDTLVHSDSCRQTGNKASLPRFSVLLLAVKQLRVKIRFDPKNSLMLLDDLPFSVPLNHGGRLAVALLLTRYWHWLDKALYCCTRDSNHNTSIMCKITNR